MIPNPYLIGGAALALVFALGAGWLWGYDTGLQKHYEFKAQVEVQQDELRKEIERQRLVSDGITADISNAWADALRRDRNTRPVVRVRETNCDTREVSGLSAAVEGLDVGTAQRGLGEEVSFSAREAEQRLNWCAQDAAQLLLIQDWLLKQHEASKK